MTGNAQLASLLAESDEDRFSAMLAGHVRSAPAATRAAAEEALASSDPRLRDLAAVVLGQVTNVDTGSRAGITDLLLPRLDAEDDPRALASAIFALGHASDPRARSGVVGHAGDRDEGVRLAVAFALPSLGLDDDALATLRLLSTDPDSDVRDWATFGLAESDASDAATIEALAARTDDPHDDTRAEGIFGLARRHDARARPLIDGELARPVHGELIERALDEFDP